MEGSGLGICVDGIGESGKIRNQDNELRDRGYHRYCAAKMQPNTAHLTRVS
jgi:hypothetical protein